MGLEDSSRSRSRYELFLSFVEAAGYNGGGWGDLCGYGRWERGED